MTRAAAATWKWFLFWTGVAVVCLWLRFHLNLRGLEYAFGWGFFIAAATAIFPAQYVYRRATYFSVPTIEDYLRTNPEAKAWGGIQCHLCGSRNIYLWFLNGPQSTGGKKVHICRGCGTKLYRSE